MPVTINPPQQRLPLGPTPNRKIFTRAECETMVETGMLAGRYELIDGEIISKMGQKPPHATVVVMLVEGHPGPGNVLLGVEISDSSLRFDLQKKASHYARTGVPEYWVIAIIGRRLICHRKPATGAYATIEEYRPEESISPLDKPDVSISVSDLLPPA